MKINISNVNFEGKHIFGFGLSGLTTQSSHRLCMTDIVTDIAWGWVGSSRIAYNLLLA